MISEAQELCVEGGRDSHSWCKCVVSRGYVGVGEGRAGDGGWYACGTKMEGLGLMSGDAGAHSECEMIH